MRTQIAPDTGRLPHQAGDIDRRALMPWLAAGAALLVQSSRPSAANGESTRFQREFISRDARLLASSSRPSFGCGGRRY